MARKKNKFTIKLDRSEVQTLAHALRAYRIQLPPHLMDNPNLISLQRKLNEQLPDAYSADWYKYK